MRAIFTIIKGNIRKGKGAFISVLCLMTVLSMTLTAVLTVNINSSKRDADALKEAGFGDMIACVNNIEVESTGITIDDLYESMENCSVVSKVNRHDCIFAQFKDLNGYASSNCIIGLQYDPIAYDYNVYKENENGVYDERPVLNDGEICVPISYQSLYDCEIGDTLNLITDEGSKQFTVRYFFEDPYMGSSTMGIKTLLFTANDLSALMDEGYETAIATGEAKVSKGTFFDVFQSSETNSSTLGFVQKLNEQTSINNYSWITLTTTQSTTYMLILVNIFCGVLIGFVVILLIVTLIIIGHSISSSIEMEYVNLGVLKAIGVSQRKLKYVLLLQYGVAIFVGSIIGIPLSIPFIMAVNRLTRPITGLCVSNRIAFVPCIVILIAILVLIELYILFKLRKITAITPVRAITGGKNEIYFNSRLQLPVRKKGLNFWMACRQLTSGIKQYIGVTLISMLLVFFLIMISGMCMWMGKDGSALVTLFNCYNSDIEVYYRDADLQNTIENRILDETEIVEHYQGNSMYLNLNNCNVYCFIYSDPQGYSSILEGRACEYDNEILVTKFIADDLDLNIGDKVTVSTGDSSAEFIISGFYQSSNDMGSNFSMLTSGYERMTGNPLSGLTDIYVLADSSKAKELADGIAADYSKEQLSCSAGDYDDIIDPILAATQSITVVIYTITIIFVIVIVIMLCSKIFAREKINIGIAKAEGFTTKMIRRQFAFQFMLVATIGSILGVLMVQGLSKYIMGLIFSYVGMSKVETSISVAMYLIPILFMMLLFYVFAYLIAGKVKKVTPKVLITE